MFRLFILTTALTAIVPSLAIAQEGKLDQNRRIVPLEVTITKGLWDEEKTLPGAAYYLGEKEIEKNTSGDVIRVVRQIPGVNAQEEDGFGLRPNIGLRGGRVDRSANITLMEDGVLAAPAPYSAPQAYYFPRIERMEGIEVLKGSSAIKYGPRTTNGAVNLLSTSIPETSRVKASIAGGSYNSLRSNLSVGQTVDNIGAVLDIFHSQSDGFKDIDVVGGDSGFSVQDIMGKLRYKTDTTAEFYQEFEFKFGAMNEESDETYLGLTTADFNADPYRRYAASQRDEMNARQKQFKFSHYIEPTNNSSLTTSLYRNVYDRSWYKLENVNVNGTRTSISSVLRNPTANSAHLDVLRGGNSAPNALQLTDGKRDHIATGIQTAYNIRQNTGDVHHDIEVGMRVHSDEQDRFHRNDDYQMQNGVMVLTTQGVQGQDSTNRISSANAFSGYGLNRMNWGAWTVTPGARYEYVKLHTEDFGNRDTARTGANVREFESTITAIIPGLGVEYQLTKELGILGGVHKGFNPPEPPTSANAANNAREEESVNYEAGLRFKQNVLKAEAIGFFTDYENLLGADTFSAGGGGALGDQFNGGGVHVSGLEAALRYDASQLLVNSAYRYPIAATYTYTQTEFQSSFNSSFSEWGNVRKGDELPYIPPHQLYVSAGVEQEDWAASVGMKYTDKMRTVAGSGVLTENNSTDSSTVFDVNGEIEVVEGARVFGTVQNLFEEEYIAAARPAGLRPGAPQIVFVGLKAAF